jgi:TPP-dependent pyruvate/acetoin dehydrogenase alpha subunit
MKIENIADRAKSYGIPGKIVDGMDVIAVREIAQQAIDRARRGNGPTLIEAKTYRYMGHSRADPGKYRKEEELSDWQSRDPIPKFRTYLIKLGIDHLTLDSLEDSIDQTIDQAVKDALDAPYPDASETYSNVYAEHRK